MKLSASSSKSKVLFPPEGSALQPISSDLSLQLNDGSYLNLAQSRGKFTLLVNTASDCGFTPQYAQLQQLADDFRETLVIIGVPANDFKKQEPGSDTEIGRFCSRNYGVTFHIARKTSVIRGTTQHPVYNWLTHAHANGWNDHAPDWNFSKYLLSPEGKLLAYFGPAVEPSVCAELLR